MAISSGSREFIVAFEGSAVDDGRMPVRDFAPSLLALADLTTEANDVSAAGATAVSLDIRTFSRGSFEVWVALMAVAGVLNSDAVTAANNLISLTTDALDLLRRINGRRIDSRTPLGPGEIRIELSDKQTIIAARDVLPLVERTTFRENARGFILPLKRTGIDLLRITADGHPTLEIPKTDAEAFDEPPPGDRVIERTSEIVLRLTVTDPSFVEGHKWRLFDGEHIDWYEMRDERFRERVRDRLEAFRNGDSLICTIAFEQLRIESGEPRTERAILEVLDHTAGDEEPPLFSE